MDEPLDIAYLRQWVGRQEAAQDVVTTSQVERFHATLALPGDPPMAGGTAPRMIHYCLCQPAASMAALGHDGHPARGDFLPPVPLPRRMWAASSIRFQGDLRIGDAIHRRSRIEDVEVKQGKSGALCFVALDHEYDQGEAHLIRERQTIVYRAAATAGRDRQAAAPAPAPLGETMVSVDPTPPLLFRYSALTFNGHRIHYDQPYAVNDEGYEGLVVHGPLQATLLFRLATARRADQRPPDRFEFRGLTPLVTPAPIRMHAGMLADDTLDLWTARENGPIAMQAQAHWD